MSVPHAFATSLSVAGAAGWDHRSGGRRRVSTGAAGLPGIRRREGGQSANEPRNAAGRVCLRAAKGLPLSRSASWSWRREPHLPGSSRQNSLGSHFQAAAGASKNRSSAIAAASAVRDGHTAQMKWLSMACGLAQYSREHHLGLVEMVKKKSQASNASGRNGPLSADRGRVGLGYPALVSLDAQEQLGLTILSPSALVIIFASQAKNREI